MKRRQVITGFIGFAAASVVPRLGQQLSEPSESVVGVVDRGDPPMFDPPSDRERPVSLSATIVDDMDDRDAQTMSGGSAPEAIQVPLTTATATDPQSNQARHITAQAQKAINKNVDFARDYADDVFITDGEAPLLHSVVLRLKNLQKTIGYGNFNLVSFDEALSYSKRFAAIGAFTNEELEFIEKVFFASATDYGFYGEKVTDKLTSQFNKSDTIKIPRSGHYLFKNESLAYYETLKRDVGESIILTSGIRSNVKQLYLFLAKTVRVNGNLSRASRSLAPPGYSYHGIGDFDVGRTGWGAKNFTDDFASTNEFKRMQDLGYIAIRYDHGNNLGVRFEPWHIKVV
ncbi:MAG: M15 family metallopeptidase [Cellvibrionaceae bacterium]